MIARGLGTIAALLAPLMLPWPFAALAALLMAPFEPLVPLAAGIIADVAFYTSYVTRFPVATSVGLAVTVLTYVVRRRLKTDIIGE